jgi:hypothetical protein
VRAPLDAILSIRFSANWMVLMAAIPVGAHDAVADLSMVMLRI